ncbi:MAG: hypothetical protein AAF737_08315 [Pseudomonadota bacterium]
MKTLITAAALSLGMSFAAVAATVATAGPTLNTAPVYNADGDRIGVVSKVVDNQTLEVSVDGSVMTVSAANVIVREDSNNDADGLQYEVIISDDAMIGK